jgi:hypothetical protein
MDKIYMVRSYFEDYESSSWKIIGLYTDKNRADELSKKWEEFYKEMRFGIFNKPKGWKPTVDDLKFSDGEWKDSYDYSMIRIKYRDIINFRYIEVEEFDLNKDMSLNDFNDDVLSLMIQWDRNHKLENIIK